MTLTRRVLVEKRRYLWPLVVLLAANAALLVLVVFPLSQRVAGGEQQAAAAANELNAARREHDAARATVAGKTQADGELRKFYEDVLPSSLSGARRATYVRLDQLARETGLRQHRQAFAPSQERGSRLGKLTLTLTLSGQYRQIRRFIHELETAPDFLVLETVTLQQQSRDEPGLNVNMQLATYYLAETDGN